MSKEKNTISNKIFQILKDKGMTQKDFSEKTGIPQSTISDWKGKNLNPAADKIMIICDVLKISPGELLMGAGDDIYESPENITISGNGIEYELIRNFRDLDERRKERLLGYLDSLIQSSK